MKVSRCLIVLLGLLLTTIGLAQDEDEATPEAIPLEIILGDFYFKVDEQEQNAPVALEVGKTYKFEFKNVGKQDHEILWGRSPSKTETGDVGDYQTNLFDATEAKIEADGWDAVVSGLKELEVKVGHASEVIITIPESAKGEWEMGCFISGHYKAGMHVPFIIQ